MKLPRFSLLAVVLLSLLPHVSLAQPASKSNMGRIVLSPERLEGSWVSTSLSGDAIWLVVKQVGVEISKDKSFVLTAVMHGGGENHYKGTYVMSGNKLIFDTEKEGKIICYFKYGRGRLVLDNKQHGITGTFKRGTLPKKNPDSLIPGMHF